MYMQGTNKFLPSTSDNLLSPVILQIILQCHFLREYQQRGRNRERKCHILCISPPLRFVLRLRLQKRGAYLRDTTVCTNCSQMLASLFRLQITMLLQLETYVAVPGRNRTLFRCVLHYPRSSAVTQYFHYGRGSYALCKLMNTWHIYTACMGPTPNGSSALQRFERSNALEIRNRIMFNFYPGLPHMYSISSSPDSAPKIKKRGVA